MCFLANCLEIFTFGHDKETFAIAAFLPKFADLPFFDIFRQVPVTAVFVFDCQYSAVFQLAKKIRIESIPGCLQGKGSGGSFK